MMSVVATFDKYFSYSIDHKIKMAEHLKLLVLLFLPDDCLHFVFLVFGRYVWPLVLSTGDGSDPATQR